jgi:putative polyketide hydroxylase
MVLHGHADPALLDTYAGERKPVARFTVEQAFSRYVARTAPWLQASQQPEPLVDDFDIEIGYLYGCSHGTHADPRTTFGMPGSRAPHIWLTRAGTRLSSIDLTGHYLLLAGAAGGSWLDAARGARDRFSGLPLDAYLIGKDIDDPEGRFGAAYGVSNSGVTLVRPDGFIAWRSAQAAPDPGATLLDALSQSLGHRPASASA